MTTHADRLAARIFCELNPPLEGWCTIAKATKLIDVIHSYRLDECLEIGVFGGRSLVAMALAGAHVIGIDPWDVDAALKDMPPEHATWWGTLREFLPTLQGRLKDALKQLGVTAELVKGESLAVVGEFADKSLDLIHIDGNHAGERSLLDVKAYLPKLRPGGFLFMDDVGWVHEGRLVVRDALDWALEYCTTHGFVDDCAILRKR